VGDLHLPRISAVSPAHRRPPFRLGLASGPPLKAETWRWVSTSLSVTTTRPR
jgi:hypothetical protein